MKAKIIVTFYIKHVTGALYAVNYKENTLLLLDESLLQANCAAIWKALLIKLQVIQVDKKGDPSLLWCRLNIDH